MFLFICLYYYDLMDWRKIIKSKVILTFKHLRGWVLGKCLAYDYFFMLFSFLPHRHTQFSLCKPLHSQLNWFSHFESLTANGRNNRYALQVKVTEQKDRLLKKKKLFGFINISTVLAVSQKFKLSNYYKQD